MSALAHLGLAFGAMQNLLFSAGLPLHCILAVLRRPSALVG
ncbi:hypothetical protein [Achromobacter xylosoxidans]|jgi:hypothetical protein|nr:hypothetical protein [Achromobacter xylosoxidans]MDH0519503.1 hypothetical protein [Achromobacter xylosoxidans]MDH0543675.1 hypothetical protein [Achromobacter xylosoxidans]